MKRIYLKQKRKHLLQWRKIGFYAVIYLVLGSAFFSLSCKSVTNQDNSSDTSGLTDSQKGLIAELNALLHPISAIPLNLADSQLSALGFLSNARIVGLGEATHGTKEFFQMKHRIFKYLVEQHGFRAFGFECDFGESLFIDRYITTGQGDLHQLMHDTMHFWTWRTDEVKVLLEWMREYNQGKAKGQMIRYLGFDCQFMTYQGEWLIQYLETVEPTYLNTVKPFLEETGNLDYTAYETMLNSKWDQIQEDLEKLNNDLIAKESRYVPISGQEEFEIAKHLARSLIQTHKVSYNYNFDDGSGINYRDMYMAENTKWIADFMGPKAKIAAWAHNGHVANNDTYGVGFSMGKYLRDYLGDAYQIVGFSFCTGFFNAKGQDASGNYTDLQRCENKTPPPTNSVNFIFTNANSDYFIFVLDEMGHDSELKEWLSFPKSFLNIGAVWNGNAGNYYRSEAITVLYDVIIHFDTTTEAGKL